VNVNKTNATDIVENWTQMNMLVKNDDSDRSIANHRLGDRISDDNTNRST
jgi:hypothetical protein